MFVNVLNYNYIDTKDNGNGSGMCEFSSRGACMSRIGNLCP
jgi:hypothetical protein